MSDDKKYYYIKLKDNFFDSSEIIALESMQDGHLYSNILLKLYLRSLKNEGRLMLNDRIPFNSTMLSQVTRHSVGVVEKALHVFRDLDIIEILDNGTIYMLDIQNFIGTSSSEADRKRKYRGEITQKMIEWDKCPPEKEIELELKINTKKKQHKEIIETQEFIEFWNRYPKKTNRKGALQSFIKEKITKEQLPLIITSLEEQKKSINWTKDNGQFIPHPATWLNQHRWEDVIELPKGKEEYIRRSKEI
jgi:predicted phage replisome organizer